MAISVTDIGSSSTAGTSTSVSTPAGVPSGTMICVEVFDNSGTLSSNGITDTGGNHYTLISSQTLNNSSSNGIIGVYFSNNVSAISTSGSISYSTTTSTTLSISAFYLTGQATASVLGNISSNFGNSNTPNGTLSTQPSQLVVAFVGRTGGTFTNPSGWNTPPDITTRLGGGNFTATFTGTPYNASISSKVPWSLILVGFNPGVSPTIGTLKKKLRIVRPVWRKFYYKRQTKEVTKVVTAATPSVVWQISRFITKRKATRVRQPKWTFYRKRYAFAAPIPIPSIVYPSHRRLIRRKNWRFRPYWQYYLKKRNRIALGPVLPSVEFNVRKLRIRQRIKQRPAPWKTYQRSIRRTDLPVAVLPTLFSRIFAKPTVMALI